MRLARYHAGGRLCIEQAPEVGCPPGGILVRTEACGLCSGELMTWYLDRKAPHVIGHEVAGVVIESQDERFPVGCRVAPHHHAPCGQCAACQRGAHVHCPTWKATRLDPGGMATHFAVSAANLADTHRVDDLDPRDAALVEPLACVAKQLRRMHYQEGEPLAVIGLGGMGLMHALVCPGAVGYDLNPARVEWARQQGIDARLAPGDEKFAAIVVAPGSVGAVEAALKIAAPEARIGLFAPLPPGDWVERPWEDYYFQDITWVNSYSCGPTDTAVAVQWLREGRVRAVQVITEWANLDELPAAYDRMKAGETVKVMVTFP